MNRYTIRELQNAQSFRAGYSIEAVSLTAAKRIASRNQIYSGTVLVIEQGDNTALDADQKRIAIEQYGTWA